MAPCPRAVMSVLKPGSSFDVPHSIVPAVPLRKLHMPDLTSEIGTCEVVSHVNTLEPLVNHMQTTCIKHLKSNYIYILNM